MRRTAIGLFIEAIGINLSAANYTGLRSKLVILCIYAFGGFCAATAGIIAAADIRGADANNAGLWLELDAILAVVIGGTSLLGGRFSIPMSVLGAIIIQAMNTGVLVSGFPPEFNLIVKAGMIIIILVLQSARIAQVLGRRFGPRQMPAATSPQTKTQTSGQYPGMWSTRVFGNFLTDNAFLGIAAVGATFVILSGGIDLSVGAVIGLTGVITAILISWVGIHPMAVFAIVLVLAAAFGASMGAVIHFLQVPPFIVTLAGMFLALGF
eukprot:gene35062-39650_t